uniref:Uncharacterized protein n=1 Tax=Anopheles atroparvus TaxID=41427 RepID=A0A182JJK4_ANOAO
MKKSSEDGLFPRINEVETAIQLYIQQELRIGHSLIKDGDIPQGVEHLANVINASYDPVTVLSVVIEMMPAGVTSAMLDAVFGKA